MTNVRLILLVVMLPFTALAVDNVLFHEGASPIDAHPQPAGWNEFYWDDGVISNGWAWYTGGNYWAVQFDEIKTDGRYGTINQIGACTYPDWPDSTYVGAYIHIIGDDGGYPGGTIGYEYLPLTGNGEYEWVDGIYYDINSATFYIAWEQIGNYPDDYPDAVGADAVAGTHNWTGYQGSWGVENRYSDFMIRCYWICWDTETTSWGGLKNLYQ